MDSLGHRRCWYPTVVIYRWRHVMWSVPLLALSGLLVVHWKHLRWDHAMAVVQLRPAGVATLGGSPVYPGKTAFETISPKVLQKAVSDTDLAEAWLMFDAETVERLRPLVSCYSIPGTATVEVTVRKLPSADCLKICEAILQHSHAEAATEQRVMKTKELRRSKEEERIAWAEFQVACRELHDWDRANPPSARAPEGLVDRFYATQSLAQNAKLKVTSNERDLRVPEAPAVTIVAPHWPGRPAARHLQHFGIAAAWTFGVSVMIAIATAYLLEAMIPRKKAAEAQAP